MRLRRPSCVARPRYSAAAALLLLAACEHKAAVPPRDSAAAMVTATAGAASTTRDLSGWDAAAGPALLVQGTAIDEAIAVYPVIDDTLDQAHLDSASTTGISALLLGRGGAQFTAHLGALPDETEPACERWLLKDIHATGTGAAWSVGFLDAHAAPVPLDSMDVLSPRDSLALAAEASRLASTVTAATGPSFQGLRFTALDIRRFQAAPGVRAFVARLTRHVNQEASPQEEQTLLVAERDSGATTGAYHLAYAERTFGKEEDIAAPELLAAVRFGSSTQPTLVVSRDHDSGIVYAFIERTGPAHWRVRWTSAPSQCAGD